MSDCVGDKFIKNNLEFPDSDYTDDIMRCSRFVYEVIRVEEGVPLFLGDYLNRLEKTIHLSRLKIDFRRNRLFEDVIRLIRINEGKNGPVKLMLSESISVLHYMKPYLPNPEEYLTGVKTIIVHEERFNPNAKIWNPALRSKIIDSLQKSGAYEAILVNQSNEITEGSRSNLFFVKGNELYTAPTSAVLPGITRMKVLLGCSLVGLKVNEVPIPFSRMNDFDSVFLTGTSRKVVPVMQIDYQHFKVDNEYVKIISDRFEELTVDYIRKWKAEQNE